MAARSEKGETHQPGTARREFWIGISLISVIPLLAFAVLHLNDLLGSDEAHWWYLLVYLLVLALGLIGYILLSRHPSHITRLRGRLEDAVRTELSEQTSDTPASTDAAAIDTYLDLLVDKMKNRVRQVKDERDHLETQLLQAQKVESLSGLATGIAHDFNNYMAAIAGNLSIVQRGLPESAESSREHAEHAEAITAKAVDLASQLLVYAGKGRFVPEKTDLTSIIHDTVESLRPSTPKNIQVELELPDHLPLVTVDMAQVRLLIQHLVLNAADAYLGEPGRVTVSAGSMWCDRSFLSQAVFDPNLPEDTYTYIEVSDKGCGMPPEIVSRIFDPFFSRKIRGRGLGLSIVFGVARAHGAAIMLRTAPDKGSSFRVFFPTSHAITDLL